MKNLFSSNKLIWGLFALAAIVSYFSPEIGGTIFLGGVLTRFAPVNDYASYDGRGLFSLSTAIANAATVVIPPATRKAFTYFWDFALLTQATTINATDVTQYQEGDEIVMQFIADATGRTITWGTNIRAGVAATFVLGVSAHGVVYARFMNNKIHILSQTSGVA